MKITTERFLKEYSEAIRDGDAALFVGAGISISAGYPSWIGLLKEIGDELGVASKDVHDLAALAQWSLNAHKGDHRIKDVINRAISPVRKTPIEATVISRLPIRSLWTTNYDEVIERAYLEIGRPIQPISDPKDLGRKPIEGASRLYKMHGSITNLNDVVISTDDYELFDHNRGAFLPLLQSQLTTSSMLFVGVSFVDPNIRHILSLIRSRFQGSGREHFAIIRPPQREDFDADEEHLARIRQHHLWADDLQRYGLKVVEIDDYDELAPLLERLEREVAKNRVWVSGSWPTESIDSEFVRDLARAIGRRIAIENQVLVTGYGLVVGSATLSGFLEGVRDEGLWSLPDRLIARPFPQPEQARHDHRAQWRALREEMAHLTGALVVVGGSKSGPSGEHVVAEGVLEEVRLCQKNGRLVIPVGASGGAAEIVAKEFLSEPEFDVSGARLRPSSDDLAFLLDQSRSIDDIVVRIFAILGKD